MYFQYYVLKKTWLRNYLKMLVSKDLSTSNMFNGAKHCLNLHSSTFNIFIDQYLQHLVGKKSFLVICNVLGQFFSTLAADDKCSVVNRNNLMQQIQM